METKRNKAEKEGNQHEKGLSKLPFACGLEIKIASLHLLLYYYWRLPPNDPQSTDNIVSGLFWQRLQLQQPLYMAISAFLNYPVYTTLQPTTTNSTTLLESLSFLRISLQKPALLLAWQRSIDGGQQPPTSYVECIKAILKAQPSAHASPAPPPSTNHGEGLQKAFFLRALTASLLCLQPLSLFLLPPCEILSLPLLDFFTFSPLSVGLHFALQKGHCHGGALAVQLHFRGAAYISSRVLFVKD